MKLASVHLPDKYILGLAILLVCLAPACQLANLNLPRVKNHDVASVQPRYHRL